MSTAKQGTRPVGVAFPLQNNGKVSTTATGKKVWIDAVKGIDQGISQAIDEEKDWRFNYPKHVAAVAELTSKSPGDALSVATNGLKALHDSLEYVRNDGSTVSLSELKPTDTNHFSTATVQGNKEPKMVVQIPESSKNKSYVGGDAIALCKSWAEYGCCEQSVTQAISAMVNLPSETLRDVIENSVFVLLGATSELGPVKTLLELGCTVACVSRRGKKLENLVLSIDSHAGKLLLPVSKIPKSQLVPDVASACGANILTELPEIIEWLGQLCPGKTLIVDSLVYLDSEANVRACAAMDLICDHLIRVRPDETVLAFLMSPATVHPTTVEAYEARKTAYAERPWWHIPFGFEPNDQKPVECTIKPVADVVLNINMPLIHGLVTFQGPNYALSKTLQQWRVIVAQCNGIRVSANLTPGARTDSVTHSSKAAAGLEGMALFSPCVAFDADTVSATMTWLLLHDIIMPQPSPPHPLQIMESGAFHGGMWRCAYTQESIGACAYIAGRLGYSVEI